MKGIRRLPVVLGFVLALLVVGIIPASASFSDTSSVSTQIMTVSIIEPTSVSGSLVCGPDTATMGVTWEPSTSAGISGYRVHVYFSDGYVQTVELGASATSWTDTIDTYRVAAYSIDYSVSAVTDYGWWRESSKQGPFRC